MGPSKLEDKMYADKEETEQREKERSGQPRGTIRVQVSLRRVLAPSVSVLEANRRHNPSVGTIES